MPTTITTRDWSELVDEEGQYSQPVKLGTTNLGLKLLEPLNVFAAFKTTFLVMFKEEKRKSLEFANRRHMMLFPLMLALITMVTTIGLQFLVGDSAAQVSNIEQKTFSWGELRFALHLPLLMFSLGMGTFAFMGQDAIIHRSGTKNFLLAAPALQPLPNSVAHFAYFIKDLLFYVMLILTPVLAGMGLGILIDNYTAVNTPLLWSSLPWTWIAMITTLAQGLAVSFLARSLWMRGRP